MKWRKILAAQHRTGYAMKGKCDKKSEQGVWCAGEQREEEKNKFEWKADKKKSQLTSDYICLFRQEL